MNPRTLLVLPLAALALIAAPSFADSSKSADQAPIVDVENLQELGIVSMAQVDYPRFARLGRVEGLVSAELVFDAEGRLSDARILSGHKAFHSAVLDAVDSWRIEAVADSRIRARVYFRFSLEPALG